MKHFFLFSCFVLLSAVAFSQYSLSGTVVNEQGEALIGANVLIENSFLGMATNSKGEFTFNGLKEGSYMLKISYLSYQAYSQNIQLTKSEKLKFTLKRSSIFSEEILVQSTRVSNKTPMAFTAISPSEIADRNSGEDIPYLLENQPSMVSTSETGTGFGYTGMRIRGTDASRINITVNGIPLNDSESHGVYWVNMPDFANSVETIQIQRGVGTSTNGAAAFGASVNFQTKSVDKKPYGELNSTFGSFGTHKENVKVGTGLINDRFSFNVRLSSLKSDGYIKRGFSDHRSFAASAAYYSGRSLLKFQVISGKQRTGITWWGVPQEKLETDRRYNPAGKYTDADGNTQFYDGQTDNYLQTHYQLHYAHELTAGWNFNAALHYTRGDGYYEQYKEDEDFADYQLPDIQIDGSAAISSTKLIRRKMMGNDFYGFTASMHYKMNRITAAFGTSWNQYKGEHFGKIIWAKWANNMEKNHQWYFNEGDKTDFTAFAKANFAFAEKLNLFADMQYRKIDYQMSGKDDDLNNLGQSHLYNFFNPKAGIYLTISDKQEAYFSFAVANREPTRSNFKDATGDENATPKPETLYDFELGYNYRRQKVNLSVNFYYMNYKNQLVPTGEKSNVGYDIMTNVSSSYRAGVELSAAVILLKRLNWNANLTFSQNKIKNFVNYADYYAADWSFLGHNANEMGETDIAYSPQVVASSIFQVRLFKTLNISFITKYVGEQFFDNTSSSDRKLDAYLVNNLAINYRFKIKQASEIKLKFQINNLLDAKYSNNAYGGNWYEAGTEKTWAYYFPQAGINFLGGISLRF